MIECIILYGCLCTLRNALSLDASPVTKMDPGLCSLGMKSATFTLTSVLSCAVTDPLDLLTTSQHSLHIP